jgi:hypothetical protein
LAGHSRTILKIKKKNKCHTNVNSTSPTQLPYLSTTILNHPIKNGLRMIIMSLTQLKMQPTIHLERKAGYRRDKYSSLPSKSSDQTPQKVRIEFIMPYTNVDISREVFQKQFESH